MFALIPLSGLVASEAAFGVDPKKVEAVKAVSPIPEFVINFNDELVDHLQAFLERLPQCEENLTHTFTPGLYRRECVMPAFSVAISRVHKTEHQFVVTGGAAIVWSKNNGAIIMQAPMVGITKPGERRVFFVMDKDFSIATYHPTTETDPQKFIESATDYPDVSHIKEISPVIIEMFKNVKLPKGLN